VYVQGKGWFVVEDTHGRTAEGKKLDQRFDMYSGKSDKQTRDALSGRADVTVYGPKESVPKDTQQKGAGEGWRLSQDKERVILRIPVRQRIGE
jgi:hypothetical protein